MLFHDVFLFVYAFHVYECKHGLFVNVKLHIYIYFQIGLKLQTMVALAQLQFIIVAFVLKNFNNPKYSHVPTRFAGKCWQTVYIWGLTDIFIEREAREIMHLVTSVCPPVRLSICPLVCALTVEPFDLQASSFAWRSNLTLARMAM